MPHGSHSPAWPATKNVSFLPPTTPKNTAARTPAPPDARLRMSVRGLRAPSPPRPPGKYRDSKLIFKAWEALGSQAPASVSKTQV